MAKAPANARASGLEIAIQWLRGFILLRVQVCTLGVVPLFFLW